LDPPSFHSFAAKVQQIVVQLSLIFPIPSYEKNPEVETAMVESGGTSTNSLFSIPVCAGSTSDKSSFDLLYYSEKP